MKKYGIRTHSRGYYMGRESRHSATFYRNWTVRPDDAHLFDSIGELLYFVWDSGRKVGYGYGNSPLPPTSDYEIVEFEGTTQTVTVGRMTRTFPGGGTRR